MLRVNKLCKGHCSVALGGVSTHSLTAALDQLRVVAFSTSNDPGPRSRQHQQIGQCLLLLVAANFFVNNPAGASSQRREECRCGLLLTVAVPAKQVCSPVGDTKAHETNLLRSSCNLRLSLSFITFPNTLVSSADFSVKLLISSSKSFI